MIWAESERLTWEAIQAARQRAPAEWAETWRRVDERRRRQATERAALASRRSDSPS